MDKRARQHFEKALFHLGVAFEIELVLQPDGQGEEPNRPAQPVSPIGDKTNGKLIAFGIEKTRKLL